MNVTIFGDRVFGDDQVKMRSLEWTLIWYDWCPYKKEKFRKRRRNVHTENAIWRWLQRSLASVGKKKEKKKKKRRNAKDCQKTTRSLERGMKQILSQPSGGANPASTFTLDFQPPQLGDNKFLLLKPPSLWDFVQQC